MSNKKLEVVELNKKEEKILIKEHPSKWMTLWKKNNKFILLGLLILSITILGISIFFFISNLLSSSQPIIKEVSVDVHLKDTNLILDPSIVMTDESAKNAFQNSGVFKNQGEVLVVKIVDKKKYTLKFFSDYTAIKIMKNENFITRINSIDGKKYGIQENGIINAKAITSDIIKTNTKEYGWGTVDYYSDGSAEIINSNFNMFVRNAKEIEENYISNNKISYVKESKHKGKIKINYYYDGTINVIKSNKSYIVRNESDIVIKDNDVIFNNKNESTITKTVRLSNGKKIDYYSDGGAIISNGNQTISVRKSNSIIVKDNKIFEIVDNIYVSISATKNNGNIIYYTNGSAVIKHYNGKTIYVKENSNIKYKNNMISNIQESYEILTEERKIDKDKILKFETVAVVETKDYIAIVPKNNILYDSDGSLKEILENNIELDDAPIKITNNTNEQITYRLVIEKSNRTNLDVQYIKYQLSVGEKYIEPKRLDSEIWETDRISTSLSVSGTNYILLEKTLAPYLTDEIKIMLWTDYERIPNTMQDKYFYGTIRIYAWQELKEETQM